MTGIVVAEIEKTLAFSVIPLPHDSPVWKYTLWATYSQSLPFMAATDPDYPTAPFNFSNLYVNYNRFYKAASYAECKLYEESFYQDGATLYVHFDDHDPPFVVLSILYGHLFGFTNHGVRRWNNTDYLPDLVSAPGVSERVDPLQYARMAFASGSAEVRNFLAHFDELASVFGNEANILAGPDSGSYADLIALHKFYVENYTVRLGAAKFLLKDRRELASVKCPSAMFDATTYPDIEEKNIGKIIPDAFGQLFGVPGICVNGDAGNVAKRFKLGTAITSISAAYVYRNELWEEVTPTDIDEANGEITLSVADAHADGDYDKGVLRVKADGVFRAETKPGDIIKKLNEVYAGIYYTTNNYDTAEWETELAPLDNVGLYMGESRELYEWIERLQNGSQIGFQYLTLANGKITARLDNPCRAENAREINAVDIRNIEEVEIDNNATLYASRAKIGYATDQESGDSKYAVNSAFEAEVLEIHRKPADYETESLLLVEADAETKAAIVMDDQKTIRPVYRGIRLFGWEWFTVRLFDIINARLSVPGYLKRYHLPPGETIGELCVYRKRVYSWSGTEWVYQNTMLPTDAWSQPTFAGLPEYPDDPAGTTYIGVNFTTADGWAGTNATYTQPSGLLRCTATANGQVVATKNVGAINGKTFILKIRASKTATMYLRYYNGSSYPSMLTLSLTTNWLSIGCYLASGAANTTVYVDSSVAWTAGDYFELEFFYDGTGATLTPPIDNSGNGHPLTANALIPVIDATAPGGRYVKLSGQPSRLAGVLTGFSDYIAIFDDIYFPAGSASEKIIAESSADSSAEVGAFRFAYNFGGTSGRVGFSITTAPGAALAGYVAVSTGWETVEYGYDQNVEGNDAIWIKFDGVKQTLTYTATDANRPALYNGPINFACRNAASNWFDGRFSDRLRILDHAPDTSETSGLVLAAELTPKKYGFANYIKDTYISGGVISAGAEKWMVLKAWLELYDLHPMTAAPPASGAVAYEGEFKDLRDRAVLAGVWTPTKTGTAAKAYYDAIEAWYEYLYVTPSVLAVATWAANVNIDADDWLALYAAWKDGRRDLEQDIARAGQRLFAGDQRCKVIGRRQDPESGEVVLDLRQCEYSAVVAAELGD